MKLVTPRQFLSGILLLSISIALFGQEFLPQEKQEEMPPELADSVQIQSYDAVAITQAFNKSNKLITESEAKHFSEQVIERYMGEVDTLFSIIDQFLQDSLVVTSAGVSLRKLDNISQLTDHYAGQLEQLMTRLSETSGEISTSEKLLRADKEKWLSILEGDLDSIISLERRLRIDRTAQRLDSINGLLQSDLVKILVQQDRLTDKLDDLTRFQLRIQNHRNLIGARLFSRELPGLFECLLTPGDTALVKKHIAQIGKSFSTDFEILKSNFGRQLEAIGAFLFIFLVFSIWFSKNYSRLISKRKFKFSDIQKTLIHSPVVTVIFVVGLLIRFTIPDLPHTFRSLNLVIMMIPMIIILIRFFGTRIRNWLVLLFVLAGLTFLYELTFDPDRLLRMILLAFSIWGLALFLWLYLKNPLSEVHKGKIIYSLLRSLLLVFSILLIISVFANLRGAFRVAEFFTIVPIQIALLAVGVEVSTTIASTLIYLFLASNRMQKVNVVKSDFKYIYSKMVLLADLLLWGLFVVISLNIFRIKDAVFGWGERLFTDAVKIGAAEVTIGHILIFILVIWLSIVITRGLRHILEKDVFPRVKTAKGVPSTIILFMQIILVSAGFLLAAAAAGIELSSLSIILGAFSVGIGFGLQNIFNNLVSGLILAVERPIKVGDVVQVGELIGTVRSIGLRSSNVKSYDGAEVIVPNGNLISKEMINWTLSDSSRRMKLDVGVAYGTDTARVIQMLMEIAEQHELVEKTPPPIALFTGFGDSALNFTLRAWTNIDNRLMVESDLYGTINKSLQKEGIEIPFPQRDLHMRSDANIIKPKNKN